MLVRLHAPPVEGKANQELLDFLSNRLNLRRSQVHLLLGEKSRQKVVEVQGIEPAALREALQSS